MPGISGASNFWTGLIGCKAFLVLQTRVLVVLKSTFELQSTFASRPTPEMPGISGASSF
jgi:hypothetical protein